MPLPIASQPPPSSQDDGLTDSDLLHSTIIDSTWRSSMKNKLIDHESQTDPIKTKEQASQARNMIPSGVQTDSYSTIELKSDAPFPPDFPSFLSRISSTILQQLEANLTSHAFDEYAMMREEEKDTYECVFELQNVEAVRELTPQLQQQQQQQQNGRSSSSSSYSNSFNSSSSDNTDHGAVLSLSWSSTGSLLCASYGSSLHTGWCNHSSHANLSFWNIMRRQISSSRPDFVIDLEACCTYVTFHPEKPTLIAGGMFNGEIRVWDLSLLEENQNQQLGSGEGADAASTTERNPCVFRTSIDDSYHREPISQLHWLRDTSTRSWQLVSIAGDGKVLFWPVEEYIAAHANSSSASSSSLNKGTRTIPYPTDGFLLTPSAKYSGTKVIGAEGNSNSDGDVESGGIWNKSLILGGTAVAFPVSGSGVGLTSAAGEPATIAAASSSATTTTIAPSSTSSGHHTFLLTTEGGGILHYTQSTILKRKGYVKTSEARWNRDAHRLLEQSDPAVKHKFRKEIEKYAKAHNIESIELETVFNSRSEYLKREIYTPSSISLLRTYDSHSSPIYGLAYCRFDSRLFATSSLDGRVKIFRVGEKRPIRVLEPGASVAGGTASASSSIASSSSASTSSYLFTLTWSPSRPLVFACSDNTGRIYIYDLVSNKLAPSLVIEVNAQQNNIVGQTTSGQSSSTALLHNNTASSSRIESLIWNAQEPSLIASGDMSGRIQVWNLSEKYTNIQPGERRLLEQMVNENASVDGR